MSRMTLEQVENEMRAMVAQGSDAVGIEMQAWADAIDAEIKTRGEPVAECPDGQFSSVVTWLKPLPPKGTKLYTAPPAPKIEVTDAMVERALDSTTPNVATSFREVLMHPYPRVVCRAALEAALLDENDDEI